MLYEHQERAEAPRQPAACARWYSRRGDEAERQYQASAFLGQTVGGYFYD